MELRTITFFTRYGINVDTHPRRASSVLLIVFSLLLAQFANASDIPQGVYGSGVIAVQIKNDSIYFHEFYLEAIGFAPTRLIASCQLRPVNDSIFQITSDINPDKLAFKGALIASETQDSIGEDKIRIRFHTPNVEKLCNYEIRVEYYNNFGMFAKDTVKTISAPVTEFIVERNTYKDANRFSHYPFSFKIRPRNSYMPSSMAFGYYYGVLYLSSVVLNWESFDYETPDEIIQSSNHNSYDIALPNLDKNTFSSTI